jgi:hypothetical protein
LISHFHLVSLCVLHHQATPSMCLTARDSSRRELRAPSGEQGRPSPPSTPLVTSPQSVRHCTSQLGEAEKDECKAPAHRCESSVHLLPSAGLTRRSSSTLSLCRNAQLLLRSRASRLRNSVRVSSAVLHAIGEHLFLEASGCRDRRRHLYSPSSPSPSPSTTCGPRQLRRRRSRW